MHWTNTSEIYVAEIIFFTFTFIYSANMLIVRGKKAFAAWIPLTIFSIMKVAGTSLLLATAVIASDGNQPSIGITIAGYVLSTTALAPLQMAAFGFLKRGCRAASSDLKDPISKRYGQLVKLIITVATILSSVGFAKLSSGDSTSSLALIQTAPILFLVSYVLILLFAIACYTGFNNISFSSDYSTYIYAIFISSPFFIVRIIYSIISGFSASSDFDAYHKFSLYNGNWIIHLLMVVLMEFFVLIIYCVAGYMVEFSAVNSIAPRQIHYHDEEAGLEIKN